MGEIAEMMLEGDLCEACGSALPGEGQGFPRYCDRECARDRGAYQNQIAKEDKNVDKPAQTKSRKGNPEKQYDVNITVVHDNRQGITAPVQKAIRYSFANEADAIDFANSIKEPQE